MRTASTGGNRDDRPGDRPMPQDLPARRRRARANVHDAGVAVRSDGRAAGKGASPVDRADIPLGSQPPKIIADYPPITRIPYEKRRVSCIRHRCSVTGATSFLSEDLACHPQRQTMTVPGGGKRSDSSSRITKSPRRWAETSELPARNNRHLALRPLVMPIRSLARI